MATNAVSTFLPDAQNLGHGRGRVWVMHNAHSLYLLLKANLPEETGAKKRSSNCTTLMSVERHREKKLR